MPDVIFRVQSMPSTYQLHNNFGTRGFELQNVTYAAYHTSEFAAGLPFRLVNNWLFRAAQQLGYRPHQALDLNRTHEFAIRIHEQGWSAQATTAALVSAARELGAGRPAARGVSSREARAR